MRKLLRNNDAQGMLEAIILIVLFFIMIYVFTIWEDPVEISKEGVIDSFSSDPEDRKFFFTLDENNDSFIRSMNIRDDFALYQTWLLDNYNNKIGFHHHEDSNNEGSFYAYDIIFYKSKTVTIKKLLYKEDGWFDKPPLRVVFSDGSNWDFRGDAEYKFDMYALFYAYEGDCIDIDYSEDYYGTIKVHNIDRIKFGECECNSCEDE